MSREDDIIALVRDRYGSVINIDERPEIVIEIIRRFGADDPDGGLPPGGAPNPPPGPTSMQDGPDLGDVMKEILKVSRQIAVLEERLNASAG
jgi:hypothetical protein